MLSINTASHLLKLCVVANCSRGVTGTRSEQLAETRTFGGYYAQCKYSQPFAETVCGSKLQQRRHRHSVRTTVPTRGLSVIMLSINTASHLLKLFVVANCNRGVTGTRSEELAGRGLFGYYAQYKYSQPFAETVCGSTLQQRRHRQFYGSTSICWISFVERRTMANS